MRSAINLISVCRAWSVRRVRTLLSGAQVALAFAGARVDIATANVELVQRTGHGLSTVGRFQCRARNLACRRPLDVRSTVGNFPAHCIVLHLLGRTGAGRSVLTCTHLASGAVRSCRWLADALCWKVGFVRRSLHDLSGLAAAPPLGSLAAVGHWQEADVRPPVCCVRVAEAKRSERHLRRACNSPGGRPRHIAFIRYRGAQPFPAGCRLTSWQLHPRTHLVFLRAPRRSIMPSSALGP